MMNIQIQNANFENQHDIILCLKLELPNLKLVFPVFESGTIKRTKVNSVFAFLFSRILVMGMPEGCCPKVHSKIHADGLVDCIANNCPLLERLEMRWDPETVRFSDKSQKAIDALRVRCLTLKCLVLRYVVYQAMQ